jgi:hypothetical protein
VEPSLRRFFAETLTFLTGGVLAEEADWNDRNRPAPAEARTSHRSGPRWSRGVGIPYGMIFTTLLYGLPPPASTHSNVAANEPVQEGEGALMPVIAAEVVPFDRVMLRVW